MQACGDQRVNRIATMPKVFGSDLLLSRTEKVPADLYSEAQLHRILQALGNRRTWSDRGVIYHVTTLAHTYTSSEYGSPAERLRHSQALHNTIGSLIEQLTSGTAFPLLHYHQHPSMRWHLDKVRQRTKNIVAELLWLRSKVANDIAIGQRQVHSLSTGRQRSPSTEHLRIQDIYFHLAAVYCLSLGGLPVSPPYRDAITEDYRGAMLPFFLACLEPLDTTVTPAGVTKRIRRLLFHLSS